MKTVICDRLKQMLSYDPWSGIIRWKESPPHSGIRIGDVAGSFDAYGYSTIMVCGRTYKGHRVAWLLFHGEWPSDYIDHINHNRGDNRITNLRTCSHAQNQHNRASNANQRSRFKGVYFQGKWKAQIRSQGNHKYLGTFETEEAAAAAYDRAALETFGEFAYTNGVGQ